MIHISVLGKSWEYRLRRLILMDGEPHESGIDYDKRAMCVLEGLGKLHTAELTADLMARAFDYEYRVQPPSSAIPVWKTTENGE